MINVDFLKENGVNVEQSLELFGDIQTYNDTIGEFILGASSKLPKLEEYKNEKGMNGKNVIDLFNRYRVIDYIRDYYEALHTTGRQYIVDDIDMYIEARQSSVR